MTYCLAIHVNDGLVFCSDSLTNAGTDNVGRYSKMHSFVWEGKRAFTLLSAGNLATTQAVIKKMGNDVQQALTPNLLTVANMTEVIDYVGMVSTQVQRNQAKRDTANTNFDASFLLGGQIDETPPEISLIYPQGNCIYESDNHPFLQIGEIKYGKPILDRVISRHTSLERAARVALVSMNSTMRSNVTVGSPVELMLYRRDSLIQGRKIVLNDDDPFSREVSDKWNKGLLSILETLPNFDWEDSPQP
ncbi:MAG: peptidase [Pseudomonadota bacterium]